ncbi:MAG: hypothetical protein ABI629_08460 [bacterium]
MTSEEPRAIRAADEAPNWVERGVGLCVHLWSSMPAVFLRRPRPAGDALWEGCYSTAHEFQAHIVKGYLEQFGVPCLVDAGRPFGLGAVQVLVRADFADVARGLIRGRETARETPKLRLIRRSDA